MGAENRKQKAESREQELPGNRTQATGNGDCTRVTVVPAKAGTHVWPSSMDARFRGHDQIGGQFLFPVACPPFPFLLSAFCCLSFPHPLPR